MNKGLKESQFTFLLFIMLSFVGAMYIVPFPQYAMWFGFFFAAYSAIANDSIQTIGTFISSNQDKKWYWIWLYVGTIFLITQGYSWLTYDGDVSHQRLMAKGFEKAPTEFHFLQVAAPVFLLIVTRMKMPVSTTFMLLTCFAASPAAVGKVLAKSMSGYILSFVIGLFVFAIIAKWAKNKFKGEAHYSWSIAQWITSGTLWSVWLMQDAANVAVYLPRSLSITQFWIFASVIFFGLGILIYNKGGRIQEIVLEKSRVRDVRFATVIDFIYCIILFYFKLYSKVPMSTTWVFLGLLAGRELGMALHATGKNDIKQSAYIMIKDFGMAFIGLIISVAIAIGVNENLSFSDALYKLPVEFMLGLAKFFSRIGF